MGLDLQPQLLQMLDDRAIDRAPQVGVMIRHDTGLVADAIVYVLHASFTEELVASAEWNLYNGSQLGKLLRSVVLDICNPLQWFREGRALRYGGHTSKYAINCLTMAFQATKRC